MIFASPEPRIDVFYAQKEAVLHLLSGENPYASSYTNVYSTKTGTIFAYLPSVVLLQTPFVSLFSDPRVLMSVADILTAILLFKLSGKSILSQILSLLYLYRPNSLFVIEQGWISPLVMLFVVLLFYILEAKRVRFFLLGLACGVLSTIQFHYSVFFLFFLLLFYKQRPFILGFFVVIAFVLLPFVLWNPSSFYEVTIAHYTQSPLVLQTLMPIHQSLSVNTLYYLISGRDYSSYVFYAAVLSSVGCLYYFSYRYLSRIKDQSQRVSFLLLCIIFFFLVFFSFSFFSFINYYYYVSGLIILWLALQVKRYV